VVTLSRELFAGLLAEDADANELQRLGVPRIDLIYVTLYPLEQAIQSGNDGEVIEKTDIGGPSLLRAAAKGRRVVLFSPAQLDECEQRLKNGTERDEKYLTSLAAAAERRVAEYVAASASYWEKHSQR
jgi:phosphoribosylaminoimidazolecarboxamide formyltransferase / IMP cyclohydrolase